MISLYKILVKCDISKKKPYLPPGGFSSNANLSQSPPAWGCVGRAVAIKSFPNLSPKLGDLEKKKILVHII